MSVNRVFGIMLNTLSVVMLTSCTLNFKGSEQDYNISARVESTNEGCLVTIDRQEINTQRKADIAGTPDESSSP